MFSKSKLLAAVFIVLFSWSMAFSAPVDQETAYQVAEATINNYLANYGAWAESTEPAILEFSPVYYKGEKIAYNARVYPSGQLLVAGSDLLSPVLLYSTSSSFDPDLADTNGSLESWIIPEVYKAFVQFEGENKYTSASNIKSYSESKVGIAWKTLTSSSTAKTKLLAKFVAAGPVLTTTWNQSPYYNRDCPTLSGQSTVVGCVATAWSQIMKYWEWPDLGEGTQTYYWTNGGQYLSETFDTEYDWDNMPDELNDQSTDTQINAVAKLCYDAGIAAEMNYGVSSSGSSAYADSYLPRFFKYKDTATLYQRSNYTASAWMALIKREFEASTPRPIAYSIFVTDGGGHEVVIDGYQEGLTDKVHINFGWAGSYNGYYDVTQNFQANGNWDGSYQAIVVNIEPDKGDPDNPWGNLPSNFQSYLVLTDNAVGFTLPSNCYTQVFGSTASNTIAIASGARAELANFVGSNTINFQEATTAFTVFRSGSTIYLTGATNNTLIKIAATTTSQTLAFTDGNLQLVISGGNIILGSQVVTTTESQIAPPNS